MSQGVSRGHTLRQSSLKKIPLPQRQRDRKMLFLYDLEPFHLNLFRCSTLTEQFLVILLEADDEGVSIVLDRIFRGYYKMNGSTIFAPSYSIADMNE